METDVFKQIYHLTEEAIPFNRFLGLRIQLLEVGRAVIELPFRPEFLGDPYHPALHGGLTSTLLDSCGGATVWSQLEQLERISTIDLRVDYLRRGSPDTLLAEGKIVRAGHRIAVVDLTAFHPSAPSEPIATGKAVYNIKRSKR